MFKGGKCIYNLKADVTGVEVDRRAELDICYQSTSGGLAFQVHASKHPCLTPPTLHEAAN